MDFPLPCFITRWFSITSHLLLVVHTTALNNLYRNIAFFFSDLPVHLRFIKVYPLKKNVSSMLITFFFRWNPHGEPSISDQIAHFSHLRFDLFDIVGFRVLLRPEFTDDPMAFESWWRNAGEMRRNSNETYMSSCPKKKTSKFRAYMSCRCPEISGFFLEKCSNPPKKRDAQAVIPGCQCFQDLQKICIYTWLVVWTPLKNISQSGWLFPI